MYTSLRASGASRKQANRYKGISPDRVQDVIDKYQNTAQRLAEEYDVDVNDITENMGKSEKTFEEIHDSP
jgi:hypothetical protein